MKLMAFGFAQIQKAAGSLNPTSETLLHSPDFLTSKIGVPNLQCSILPTDSNTRYLSGTPFPAREPGLTRCGFQNRRSGHIRSIAVSNLVRRGRIATLIGPAGPAAPLKEKGVSVTVVGVS